jgi:signal transduction histidine kinase
MMGRMWRLRRSMLVQMVLLATLFLGWGVYAFVVRPVLDIPSNPPRPANAATGQAVQEAIRAFIFARKDGASGAPLDEDPVIRAVAARNPQFRYFVRIGDATYGNAPAVYYHALGFDRLAAVRLDLPRLRLCTTADEVMMPDGVATFANFTMCDTVEYFEYRGLDTATIPNSEDLTPLYRKWFWAFGSQVLLPAIGLFLIFAVVLLTHVIQIRRVARLAGSFDPQSLDRSLPIGGLATEIVPLVRAINHLLGQAEDAQRRKRFFLSAAAHEMRTPLTVLRTRVELLEPGEIKDKLIGDLRRLIDLVNQLLELMRIGESRRPFGLVDLATTARRVAADLAIGAAERAVVLEYTGPDRPCEIMGDRALIRSALANLIENAVNVSPRGGRVIIAINAVAEVTVRDTGPGLPQDMTALFEPFVRFPISPKGHGLGLAIVKAVADLHGAHVSARNGEEGGAVFTITFGQAPGE